MQNNYTNDLLELKGENIKITNVYKEGYKSNNNRIEYIIINLNLLF